MNQLHLSENIIRLRRERKLTQEELADFLGVTKAAVSKWENGQTSPDILLLPQLACFFDVTIDQLLGYEAQLSGEQIRRCYMELCQDFVNLPFQEVYEKTRSLAHRYYSCYPFLLQLCVLYANHYMLAETEDERERLHKEAISWCDHILVSCSDVGVCSEALVLKAGLSLQSGKAAETIAMLEPVADTSCVAAQNGAVLVQAYQMAGEHEKARDYIQVREYLDLVNLMSDAILSLSLYQDDLKRCRETICRIRSAIDQYRLEELHPNLAAQFHYQTAAVYAANGEAEEALEALGHFKNCTDRLLRDEKAVLHGDEYFDRIDAWIDGLPLGDMAPRSRKFISQKYPRAQL